MSRQQAGTAPSTNSRAWKDLPCERVQMPASAREGQVPGEPVTPHLSRFQQLLNSRPRTCSKLPCPPFAMVSPGLEKEVNPYYLFFCSGLP